jgi:hypothetical protein
MAIGIAQGTFVARAAATLADHIAAAAGGSRQLVKDAVTDVNLAIGRATRTSPGEAVRRLDLADDRLARAAETVQGTQRAIAVERVEGLTTVTIARTAGQSLGAIDAARAGILELRGVAARGGGVTTDQAAAAHELLRGADRATREFSGALTMAVNQRYSGVGRLPGSGGEPAMAALRPYMPR